jgi:hypothetical protein
MHLRVECIHDPGSRNWCFRVPSLGILGGADTRDEAERAVLDAIAYALEDSLIRPAPTRLRSSTSSLPSRADSCPV